MSKNPGRELRKFLRKKFTCFRQADIRVGKYGPKRKYIRICFNYDMAPIRKQAVDDLEKFFNKYNNSYLQMHRYSTCKFLEIILKVDFIDSIIGLMSLSL